MYEKAKEKSVRKIYYYNFRTFDFNFVEAKYLKNTIALGSYVKFLEKEKKYSEAYSIAKRHSIVMNLTMPKESLLIIPNLLI